MKVSIVLNNFNYARYLPTALESALAQTWRQCEVIVVDDGSTDDSWSIIERYAAERGVIAIKQANGGQGAAYNAGFAASSGEAVLFLDADDALDVDAVERCMQALQDGVSHVQFRLRLMDDQDQELPGTVPYRMHSGDVTPLIRLYGHYAGPPSSGNFYRRSAIASAFPVDPSRWRRAADTVPFLIAPFFGQVVSIEQPLGRYRLHRGLKREGGRPRGIFGNISTSFRDQLLTIENRRAAALDILATRSGIRVSGPFLPLPWSLRTRALSWRLDRPQHPYPNDTALTIIKLQFTALRDWPGYKRLERLLMVAWVTAAVLLPRSLLQQFAASNTDNGAKAWIRRLTGATRGAAR